MREAVGFLLSASKPDNSIYLTEFVTHVADDDDPVLLELTAEPDAAGN